MNEISLKALAKINLSLDVLSRRPDGYHEVQMVMQSIQFYDRVRLKKTRAEGFRLSSNLGFLPTDDRNLMVKAARLMFETYGLSGGLYMELQKYIPVAAGMAGGSTDAAAVIFGINRMYDLHLSLSEQQKVGVQIGADVPYCLMRGTALSEGIGEKLQRLPACPPCYIVVAKPPVSVSTKTVYEAFDALTEVHHPDTEGMLRAIRESDLHGVAASLGNVLEEVTIPLYPVIGELKETLLREGALGALMSGSGPTVFGLFEDREQAEHAASVLRAERKAAVTRVTEIR